MAYIRLFLIILILLAFFVAAAPLQLLLAALRSPFAASIPVLFCKTMLRLLRVRVEIEGAPLAPGPVLLVANHVSWIDILAFGSTAPICFLAKSEVAAWPIVSTFARLQGTVFVERHRRRGIPPANHAMADRMREGRVVLLFPEGTTYEAAAPGRFHTSHFAAARDLLRRPGAADGIVAVQPVALAYSSDLAAWIGEDTLMAHLWRVLRHPPMTCGLIRAEPIPYRADSDRKAVAAQARATIVALTAERYPRIGLGGAARTELFGVRAAWEGLEG